MVLESLFFFVVAFVVLLKSADFATIYASRLAKAFHLSEFVVSFFIVAVISVLPESTIAIMSSFSGSPQFGLGTLLGSNVADLTLVFGIIVLFSAKGLVIKSEIIKKDFFYLFLLLFPILLGFDGHFSRADGLILVMGGSLFFYTIYVESRRFHKKFNGVKNHHAFKNFALLVLSVAVMLLGAHYSAKFGIQFANLLGVPPVLIGLTLVSAGTCLPELMFALRAVNLNYSGLALGDVLGNVIIDATIIVGILALIKPFSFDPVVIEVTGLAMFLAGVLLISFMRSGRILSKKEGVVLLFVYILFLIVQFLISR